MSIATVLNAPSFYEKLCYVCFMLWFFYVMMFLCYDPFMLCVFMIILCCQQNGHFYASEGKKNIKTYNAYFMFSKNIKVRNASHTAGKNINMTNASFMFLKNIK